MMMDVAGVCPTSSEGNEAVAGCFCARDFSVPTQCSPSMALTACTGCFLKCRGTSLAVQWLRLRAPNAGGTGLTPGRGAKIPHAVGRSLKITN